MHAPAGSPAFKKLAADTYTLVLPAVAHTAAEEVASLIIQAGCPAPGADGGRAPGTGAADAMIRKEDQEP